MSPLGMSSVAAARSVIGVRRSWTMSVISSALRRTAACPLPPGRTRTASSLTDNVQVPAVVSIVNGRTPSSRAPGTASAERSAAKRGSWLPKKSTTSIVSTSTSSRVRKSIVMTDQASDGTASAQGCRGSDGGALRRHVCERFYTQLEVSVITRSGEEGGGSAGPWSSPPYRDPMPAAYVEVPQGWRRQSSRGLAPS